MHSREVGNAQFNYVLIASKVVEPPTPGVFGSWNRSQSLESSCQTGSVQTLCDSATPNCSE